MSDFVPATAAAVVIVVAEDEKLFLFAEKELRVCARVEYIF